MNISEAGWAYFGDANLTFSAHRRVRDNYNMTFCLPYEVFISCSPLGEKENRRLMSTGLGL